MAIRFYQERETGDLLFVYYKPGHVQHLEGCANAIARDPSSLCWTVVGTGYLEEKCERLARPKARRHPHWRTMFSFRADWMARQIHSKGLAVLPY
jgi:hypothetical protein